MSEDTNSVSRRSLLKGAAVGGLGLVAGSTLAAGSADASTRLKGSTVRWTTRGGGATGDKIAKAVNDAFTKKTGAKVTIPIHPMVRQILEKYKYVLPEVPPNNEFNRIIKLVGEQLPALHVSFVKQITYQRERKQVQKMKYEFLQTHTARRSFCSNEYLRGTDPMVIMAISGHKSHKSFMRYIKVSNEQFADKLEQIWAERV